MYYHIYSGEKLSSLNALRANLEYVRTQKICPLPASRYAAIGDGFLTTELEETGPDRWRVMNRGMLQTIRFDNATFKKVDFVRSIGVLGQKHYQGSLYVTLDQSVSVPVVALAKRRVGHGVPRAAVPYLLESRWDVWGLEKERESFSFKAQGYGPGEMLWTVPEQGYYRVVLSETESREEGVTVQTSEDRTLALRLETNAIQPLRIKISRE